MVNNRTMFNILVGTTERLGVEFLQPHLLVVNYDYQERRQQYMTEFFESDKGWDDYDQHMLVLPNYTDKDLNADSFVVVMRQIIMNTMDRNIYWTILVPKGGVQRLRFPNVEQVEYDFDTYPQNMRMDFRPKELAKKLQIRTRTYEFIYSHLPELTTQLLTLFHTNRVWKLPRVIGYCHWFEIPESDCFKHNMFHNNIVGILQMEECGVNSQWVKDLVLRRARTLFNDDVIQKLDRIIKIHRLGCSPQFGGIEHEDSKIILFNHRDDNYTGFSKCLEWLDELWEKRQDFTLVKTLECKEERPYLVHKGKLPLNEYQELISRSKVGVGCFQKYSAWSLSATDGMSKGLPYILPKKLCYVEMMGSGYPLLYKNKKEFLTMIETALDDPNFKRTHRHYLQLHFNECSTWKCEISHWFMNWKILEQ